MTEKPKEELRSARSAVRSFNSQNIRIEMDNHRFELKNPRSPFGWTYTATDSISEKTTRSARYRYFRRKNASSESGRSNID